MTASLYVKELYVHILLKNCFLLTSHICAAQDISTAGK